MTWFVSALKDYPELALFLTLAIGYAIGKIKIGNFVVGSVTGVLLTGVVIGQLDIQINTTVKSVFFLLFLFALGYNVGPQFFQGLKKDGLPQVLFSVIVCGVGLVSVIIAGKILGYNAGQVAGLTAGALTQSAVIGVGQGAIASLNISDAEKQLMSDFVPIGYAVTYIFGTIGSAFFLSTIAPKLYGVDLVEEAKKLSEKGSSSSAEEGIYTGASTVEYRVFQLADQYVGQTIKQVEEGIAGPDIRSFILRIRRKGQIIEADESIRLEKNDRIVFSFRTGRIGMIDLQSLGTEVSDLKLLDFPLAKQPIYVNSDTISEHTIKDVRHHMLKRGVFISNIREKGTNIEYDDQVTIHTKEIVTIEGPKVAVDEVAHTMGKLVRQSSETDVIFLGLGILIGGLIGIPALKIGGVGLSLSTSGGALIMGLIFGYIHDRRPIVGRIPKSAIWFLNNVGLAAFIAVVGINAGPGFISGLKQSGLSFFIAGAIVTLIPLIVGVYVGKYIFKWNAALTLGACAGAMTTTAAIGAVCEKAKSNSPVLGYTVTYAIGNILLTIWGSIVILFFS